jgi:hypothetical protein
MNAANCPQPEELRKLLDGSLSGDQQQACVDHMDACACCQTRLEGMATEGTNLSRVIESLHESEPVATSAYWPALRALEGGGQSSGAGGGVAVTNAVHAQAVYAQGAVRPAKRPRDVPLDFLQPATDSAYLGRLAHFDVMRVIGRGGMGIVFEAFDSRLQRNVALKVLEPELADDDIARQRFCREARAAASVTHENVVAVHQVEKSTGDNLPYLVMQLVAGESLEQRLDREKKLPLREIVRIGMQAAHGLAAAHAQGLIHRDIKPGNILLEPPHDRVKLTDFGLARAAEDVKLTRTGFVSGTPLYMAPEQARGEKTDHRSDLFSLGAILYEMCSGQPPFAGDSALAILRQITETKHRPLGELDPQIPEWLATTVDKLLAKKPDDRIQSAEHLAELLDFQWAHMQASSEDVPTVCRIESAKRAKRNRWIAGGVGAVFLSAGLLGGMLFARRDGAAPQPASTAAPVAVLGANAGAVWSVAFDPESDTVAMAVEDGAVRLWDLPGKSVKSTFAAHRGFVWAVCYSRDNEFLATAGDDGLIKLWRPGQHEPFKVFQHANAVRGLALTHDNRALFGADRGGVLRAWSLDSEQPLAETQQPGSVNVIAISPDDKTLASGGSDKIVRLWNTDDLSQKLVLEGHTAPIYSLSFNRDGRRLASVGWDKFVRIWDTGTGQPVKTWEGHPGDIWGVAYSPDGSKLATGGSEGAVKLWDAETGALLATFLGHSVAVHAVTFNSDGTLLASAGRDGAVRIWKIE